MTEKREFYAATAQEAVAKAAEALRVEAKEVSYRVVDPGNSGFLGIGARDARIEVDVPSTADATEPVPEIAPTLEEPNSQADTTEAVDYPGAHSERKASQPTVVSGEQDEAPQEPLAREVIDKTEVLVGSLLQAMGFEARVDVYDAGGFVAVDVVPDNTALFIGQKGETIDALQYLVNASINKRRASRARIVIDAEGYRQRRVEALQGMAHRTARRVVREDRTVELPPMNPAERRVVHLFLQDNPRVTTESEGTGDSRRVRVSPA